MACMTTWACHNNPKPKLIIVPILMHCELRQRNVYSDLIAFVFSGSFLLPSLGPAELTLTPFEVCGNPKIRSDALEWVGPERR